MKKILLLICFFPALQSIAQFTFKTRINIESNAFIYNLIQLNNGDYVSVGTTNNYTSNYNDTMVITKLNAQGTLLASKIITNAGDCDGYSIIKTQDGGIAVGGILNDQLGILKFDTSLNLLWKKQYSYSEDGSEGIKIIQAKNGDFLIGDDVFDNGNTAAYLVRTDSQGNLIFAKRFFDFTPDDASINIYNINETSDGNFILLAGIQQPNNTSTIYNSYLIKINPQGSIIWSRRIDDQNNYNNSAGMIQTADNSTVICGQIYKSYSTALVGQMLMAKIDASGNTVWSQQLNLPDTAFSIGYSVLEDKDGGYVFSGSINNQISATDINNNGILLVKLNKSGSLVWTKGYDSTDNFHYETSFRDLISTRDGGYAGCGQIAISKLAIGDTAIQNVEIIYKMNSNFFTCGETSINASLENNGILNNASVSSGDLNITVSDADITVASLGTATYSCQNSYPISHVMPSKPAAEYASYEYTDSAGWTNYYYNNNTPADFTDDTLVLSIKKNGQNIGTIGDGTFTVKLAATALAGSGDGVQVTSPLITNPTGFYAMNRYWQVTATTEPTSNVGLRFYYNNQDLKDVNGSLSKNLINDSLIFYKAEGGNPDPTSNLAGAIKLISILPGTSASNTTWMYHTFNDTAQYAEFSVSGFSGGGGGATGNNLTLPLSLLSFSVRLQNNNALLNWQTATEINTDHFFVQRSSDGSHFITIGKIIASGNSSSIKSYAYTDVNAASLNTTTLYYRLQSVDKDGKKIYSDVRIVRLSKIHSLFTVSPNPTKDYINIIAFDNIGAAQVKITDLTGKTLYAGKQNFAAGQQVKVSLSQFPSQVLILTIAGYNNHEEFKVVKE